MSRMLRHHVGMTFRLMTLKARADMAFRASFCLLVAGDILMALTEFVGVWALLWKFDSIGGWTLPQVALLFGIIHFSFAAAECFGKGFEQAHHLVYSGDFDRLLLRPCGVIEQLIGRSFSLRRIGGMTQGIIMIFWALHTLGITGTVSSLFLLGVSLVSTTLLFYSLFMLHGVASFYVLRRFEPLNILTYGMKEAGSFPITMYPQLLQAIVLLVLPVGATVFIPAAVLLDKPHVPELAFHVELLFPAMAVAVWALSTSLWRKALRAYESTGS